MISSGESGVAARTGLTPRFATKQELALPPKIELAHAKGFSLYMLRAVLKGQGNEIIERAKTNLR